MKNFKLALFVFALFIALLGLNVGSASAEVSGCNVGDNFSRTTGQACTTLSVQTDCRAGDLFSSLTGAPCTGVQSDTSDVTRFNALFKTNFTVGLRGSTDVRALQQFLKDEGYYFGKIDGSYGRITDRAVKDFRDDNNLTITTTYPYPYPTPVSDNYVSETVKCVFNGSTTEQKCYPAISGSDTSIKASGCTGISACVSDVRGLKGTSVTWKSSLGGYAYTTLDGQNEYASFNATPSTCSTGGFDSTTGWPCGCTSASGFSLTTGVSCGGSNTSTPVISGAKGPQTLRVGQQETWSVSAYDPNGGSLSYEVVWGDEGKYTMAQGMQQSPSQRQQSATFTHSYSTAGIYSPTFTVRNAAGYLAQTSLSVNVGNSTSVATLTILSPEDNSSSVVAPTLSWTNSIPISVTASYYIAVKVINAGGYAAGQVVSSTTLTSEQAGCSASDRCTWGPLGVGPGTYSVFVQNLQNNASDSNMFIVGGNTATPSITVTSPWSGGEKVNAGSSYTVRWNSSNIPNTNNMLIYIISKPQGYSQMIMNAPNVGYQPINIPSQLNGDYEFMIQTTVNGAIYSGSSFASIIPSTSKGDLIISDLTWTPVNPTVSQTDPYVYVTFTVKNIGNTPVFVPTDTYFGFFKDYNSSNQTSVGGMSIGTGVFTLQPGESKTFNNITTLYSPSIRAQSGTFQFYVVADANNIIPESNETNNELKKTMTVGATQPSITVTSPNGGENYKVGDTVPIRWSSVNAPYGVGVLFRISYQVNGVSREDMLSNTNGIEFGQVNNNGVLDWTVPSKYGVSGLNPNSFKLHATLYGPGISGNYEDFSDSYFTITASTTSSANVTASLVASSSTASQFVPAANGAPNATKATYNFTSSGGTSTISELKFTVNDGSNNTVTSVTAGGVTAPVVGGTAYLTGLNLTVPSGGAGLNQDAYVSYSPVGTNGVRSGSTSSIALTHIKYVSNGMTTISTPNISAPTMKLVGSKPALSISSSGAMLAAGLVDVAHITVAADSKGDITLNQLPISYRLTGATLIDGVVVKDQNGQQVSISSIGNSQINFTGGYLIPAGTNQTFKVYFQLGAIEASGANLTVGLGLPGLFGWTDTAGNSSTSIIGDNATYFYNYPTTTVTASS